MLFSTDGQNSSSSSTVDKPPSVSPKEIGACVQGPLTTIEDVDERLLARIGYKQVCLTIVLLWNGERTDTDIGAEA